MSDMVPIESCATREEAEHVRSLLETNGIQAMIATDDAAGLIQPTAGGVLVQVLKKDVLAARKIIGKE